MDRLDDIINCDLIDKIVTPSYIFNISELNTRILAMRKVLSNNINLCYAMKANPFIVKYLSELVDRLEVCSYGEYEICKKQNIDPQKIIISGVNKTKETINEILEYSNGQGIYTIESEKHLDILVQSAKEKGYVLDVIIRLTSGNQFGVDKKTFENIIEKINNDNVLNLLGIHYYSGTQKKIKKVIKEIAQLDEYAKYIKENFGIKELELEYGPGLMVEYFQDDKVNDTDEQLNELKEALNNMNSFNKITLEFGRFIASSCGYYCTKINDIKNGQYIILDGGIHQVSYYGQIMGMKKPFMKKISCNNVQNISNNDEDTKWTLCGSLCTANDIIVRDVPIDNPCINDIIVFENVGAYSVTEGISLFLSRELPAVYVYTAGKMICVREKLETNTLNTVKS